MSVMGWLLRLLILSLLGKANFAPAASDAKNLSKILSQAEITQAERYEIFLQGEDDPQSLMNQLFILWQEPTQSQNTLMRVRIAWLMGIFRVYQVSLENFDYMATLTEALKLMREHNLTTFQNELEFDRLFFSFDDPSTSFESQAKEILKAARAIEDKEMRQRALAMLAFSFSERGVLSDELPGMLDELQQLLNGVDIDTSILSVEALNSLALALKRLSRDREFTLINQILEKSCASKKMRFFCSTRAYNEAFYLLFETGNTNITRVLELFQKSLALAQEIQHLNRIGDAYYGLNLAFNKNGQYQEAIQYGRRAEEVFAKIKALDWQAATLKNLSVSYRDAKDLKSALAAANKALEVCPPNYNVDLNDIYMQLKIVHKDLGNFAESLKYLELYLENQRAMNLNNSEKKYIDLRNQSLSHENAWQAKEIDLLKSFRLVSFLAACLAFAALIAFVMVWR